MTRKAVVIKVRDPFGTQGEVITGKNFYVSYNPRPAPIFGNSGPETALVKKDGEEISYRILRGRWIDEYLKLVPGGWEKCLAFYNKNKEVYGSKWSTDDD